MTKATQQDIYRGYDIRYGGEIKGYVIYYMDNVVHTADTLEAATDWIDAEKRKQSGNKTLNKIYRGYNLISIRGEDPVTKGPIRAIQIERNGEVMTSVSTESDARAWIDEKETPVLAERPIQVFDIQNGHSFEYRGKSYTVCGSCVEDGENTIVFALSVYLGMLDEIHGFSPTTPVRKIAFPIGERIFRSILENSYYDQRKETK